MQLNLIALLDFLWLHNDFKLYVCNIRKTQQIDLQIDFCSWHNKEQCDLFKINPIQSSFQFV